MLNRSLLFASLPGYPEFVIVLYDEMQLALPMAAEAQPNPSPSF